MKQYLTHQPYAPWCEFCISNRAREDVHQSVTPSSAGSVVSFGFGYVSRLEDEKDKLTGLFAHDQHTKMMHSVPTQQKGGRSLVYLCTELVRFILHLGHQAVILRCDDEPSTVALANSTRKSLRSFGVACKLEFVTVGNHQGNGAAEVTVQVIRQLGMCFLQRLEAGGGLDKPVFGAHHPLTAWCLVHASLIQNRYATTSGQTAYERAFDSPYQGRICQFGEVVLAYVKSTKKGAPRWLKGVWLTKTLNHDAHVIALPSAIVCTRWVRRLCNQWELERCGSLEQPPWEFGLATLGSKLVSAKRIIEPATLTYWWGGICSFGWSCLWSTKSCRDYWWDYFGWTCKGCPSSWDCSSGGARSWRDCRGCRRQHTAWSWNAKPHARYEGPPTPFPEPMELGGSASTRARDLDDSARPAKQAKVSAPAQQIMAAMEIDHEDEPNLTQFLDEELDYMEDYDYNIEDEQMTDENFEGNLESMLDRLSKPYSKEEPMMDAEELQELDALADLVEIARLQQQGVLIPSEQVVGDDIKTLSTKFVRSWRQKERRGARCWLRRSGVCMANSREGGFVFACQLGSGESSSSLLLFEEGSKGGKDPSYDVTWCQWRFPHLEAGNPHSGYLFGCHREKAGIWAWQSSTRAAWWSSTLVPWYHGSSKASWTWRRWVHALACFVPQIAKDDVLVVGDYSFIELQLLPVLREKYELSMELMREPGDEVTFLKRNHVLISKTEMVIYPHEKHFHKLFDLLKTKRSWKPKNVPSHTMINEVASSAELGPQQASTFRSAVGVLLYMASDLVECQFTIRHLARCMASPTSRGWEILKHLVCYLLRRSESGASQLGAVQVWWEDEAHGL